MFANFLGISYYSEFRTEMKWVLKFEQNMSQSVIRRFSAHTFNAFFILIVNSFPIK